MLAGVTFRRLGHNLYTTVEIGQVKEEWGQSTFSFDGNKKKKKSKFKKCVSNHYQNQIGLSIPKFSSLTYPICQIEDTLFLWAKLCIGTLFDKKLGYQYNVSHIWLTRWTCSVNFETHTSDNRHYSLSHLKNDHNVVLICNEGSQLIFMHISWCTEIFNAHIQTHMPMLIVMMLHLA